MHTNHARRAGSIALALAMAAGTIAIAQSQPQQTRDYEQDRNQPQDRTQDQTRRPGTPGTTLSTPASRTKAQAHAAILEFHKASDLIGKDVFNPNGDDLGEITDFIFERGSGQIQHAVLKSGSFLGMGGKSVVIPFSQLSYDHTDDRFGLDMTKEQIDRTAAFAPDNWAELDRSAWEGGEDWLDGLFTDDASISHDSYAPRMTNARPMDIDGEIISVRRDTWIDGQEQAVAVVRTRDNTTHEVVLGPSWYVMGQDAAPMRGDSIKGRAMLLSEPTGDHLVLSSATINGKDLTLRDDDGTARWTGRSDLSADAQRTRRLVLMSTLIGAEARAAGQEDAGSIDDAVIERNSGRIALVSFDPEEHFLGIGEDNKAIPWSVVNLSGHRHVRIDATLSMIERGPTMPDNVATLSTPAQFQPIYQAFGVEPTKFDKSHQGIDRTGRNGAGWDRDNRGTDNRDGMGRDGMGRDAMGRTDGPAGDQARKAWGKDGEFTKALREGERVSITGEVLRTQNVTFRNAQARALVISTAQGDRTVILGPDWYLDRQQGQQGRINDGDRVTIQGRSATLDGRSYIAAHSVQGPNHTLTLWDNDRTPVWIED